MKKLIIAAALTFGFAGSAFADAHMGLNMKCSDYLALDEAGRMAASEVIATEWQAIETDTVKTEDKVPAYVMEKANDVCETQPDATVSGALDTAQD